MKLNDPKVLDTIAGFMVASLLGLILFIVWGALTGNLIMPEPEYQRRKIELATKFWLIIGGTESSAA